MACILIAEDDPEIAGLERDYLEMADHEIIIASDGLQAEELLKNQTFDLLILDIMLPEKNGYDLCRQIRDVIDIPILMVTAKTESIDIIRGLGLGADDYIIKPFDPAELVARVNVHLKRYQRLMNCHKEAIFDQEDVQPEYVAEDYGIEIGNLRIMLKSWKVFKNNQEVHFPNREFELLKFLAINPNIVFSKEYLIERIWGFDYVEDSATVTVHINRIREKIEEDPKNPKIIETVWGAGYRLNM